MTIRRTGLTMMKRRTVQVMTGERQAGAGINKEYNGLGWTRMKRKV